MFWCGGEGTEDSAVWREASRCKRTTLQADRSKRYGSFIYLILMYIKNGFSGRVDSTILIENKLIQFQLFL